MKKIVFIFVVGLLFIISFVINGCIDFNNVLASTEKEIPNSSFSLSIEGNVQPYIINPRGNASGINSYININKNTTMEDIFKEDILKSEVRAMGLHSSIQIDDPIDGEYSISLKGSKESKFRLILSYFDNTKPYGTEIQRKGFYHDEIINFKVLIDSNSNKKISIIEPVSPPADIKIINNNGFAKLSWQHSIDSAVLGYNIYTRTIAQPDRKSVV